jgi:hypothetical protein
MDLTSWLYNMVSPLVARVLASMGLSMISIKGVDVAFDQVRGYMQTAVNSFPADLLKLGGLYGFDTAFQWILGAMAFSLTMWALKSSFSFFGSAA